MPGDGIKVHTHVCAQFWSYTWLAEPVSVLTDKTQIPAAEGLLRAAWCHQPHMLPMEELFGNAHPEKSTSRKQHTRWSFLFNLILIITRNHRNSSSSFTRKVTPQCTNKLKEVLSINIWIHHSTATVSSERSVQESTAALAVTQSQSLEFLEIWVSITIPFWILSWDLQKLFNQALQ